MLDNSKTLISVLMEAAGNGDLLPSVLGPCLYESLEMVLAKAVLPISQAQKRVAVSGVLVIHRGLGLAGQTMCFSN